MIFSIPVWELTYNYLGKSKVNIDDLFEVEWQKKRPKVLARKGFFIDTMRKKNNNKKY